MDQVSRPVLIAFSAVLLLAGVWLVALRPKPVTITDTPLAPTKAIPAAKRAGAVSDAANAKLQAADPAAAGPAARSAPRVPAPADAAAAPAAPAPVVHRGDTRDERVVLSEVAHGKVVVLLFWSADGADDVATRGVVRSLSRHKGRVKVHVIPIGRVGDYGSITRSVKIARSPTTLVIGHGGQTHMIVGLTDPKELGQAVGDAIAKR